MTTETRYRLVAGTVVLILLSPALVAAWFFFLFLIGHYTGPSFKTPFPEAHARAVTTFVENEGFGFSRFRRHDLWRELSLDLEGTEYRLHEMHLIGLTSEKGERSFVAQQMPRKASLAEVETRKLTPEETHAITQLRAGQPWSKITPPPAPEPAPIRVIAPIFAQQSCLECHEVKEGTLLGAFDYELVNLK